MSGLIIIIFCCASMAFALAFLCQQARDARIEKLKQKGILK